MSFSDFRDWIQDCLRGGVNAGSTFLKLRTPSRSIENKMPRPPTPPLPSSQDSGRDSPIQAEDPTDKEIEELAELFKEMKVQKQQLRQNWEKKVETMRQLGVSINVQEAEELRTFVQIQQRGRGSERRVAFKPGDRAYSAPRAKSPMAPGPCYYCGSEHHVISGCLPLA
jgi:hypothetical protein